MDRLPNFQSRARISSVSCVAKVRALKAVDGCAFAPSGSTLIAAEATGRVCRGVELDPLYVDVIIRRYKTATGDPAVLVETGEPFDVLAARRATETTLV